MNIRRLCNYGASVLSYIAITMDNSTETPTTEDEDSEKGHNMYTVAVLCCLYVLYISIRCIVHVHNVYMYIIISSVVHIFV